MESSAPERVLAYLAARRGEIGSALAAFLSRRSAELARVSPLGAQACSRLVEFASRGKMLRGGLVCYAASLGGIGGPVPIGVAAAMELFQSALLVHDDIMDRDTHRRGSPAVHHQYAEQARGDGLRDAAHVGEALGICAGDIAFFLAFEQLAELDLAAPSRARLVSLFARELSLVGAAQMMDMVAAAGATEQTTEEILRLYLYKTGRYTFSLPLLAGADIGGLDGSRARELEQAGEQLGMLFQIKDDEIGIFGDPAEAGKPVGSDVREGKKTIFHASLMRRAPPGERDRIRTLWGRADLADADVLFIFDAMDRHGVRAEVEELVGTLADRAAAIAARIGSPFLDDLLAYSLDRRR